jgi:uncharacterized protein (TIRG00374 family)
MRRAEPGDIAVKTLALCTTLLILVLLYTQIDLQALVQHVSQMSIASFLLALSFFIPQLFVTTLRWCYMVHDVCPLGTLEAAQLILAGKALNALVPSKLGEMSKAYFLKTRSHLPLPHGIALVLLEKVFDTVGLCTLLLAGVLLLPHLGLVETLAAVGAFMGLAIGACLCFFRLHRVCHWLRGKRGIVRRAVPLLTGWDEILVRWRKDGFRLAGIVFLSCGLWVLHLVQIYLFFVALHSSVGLSLVFAYVPIGLFIGLLPVTIGGMGTRDSALILLFAPYESAAVIAGVGLLCSLRYWLDTLLGLPFFHRYSFDTSHAERTAQKSANG